MYHMNNLPDGVYDLGLAPTASSTAKLVYRVLIKKTAVYDLKYVEGGVNWCTNIEFILRSGECSINETKPGHKWLLLSSN